MGYGVDFPLYQVSEAKILWVMGVMGYEVYGLRGVQCAAHSRTIVVWLSASQTMTVPSQEEVAIQLLSLEVINDVTDFSWPSERGEGPAWLEQTSSQSLAAAVTMDHI